MFVQAASKLDPSAPEPYCCLADIYMAQDNRERAITIYRRIIAAFSDYSSLINLAVCLSKGPGRGFRALPR